MSIRKLPSDKKIIYLYNEKKMSSGDIAKKYGCARGTVCRHIRRLGIIRPESGPNSRNRNYNKKQYRSGYPVTFLPEHPRSNNIGYVYDHILIIEKEMGFTPTNKQPIHHIDCDRNNCDISNLVVFDNHKQHLDGHHSINKIIKPLLKKGAIVFNREKGIYELMR